MRMLSDQFMNDLLDMRGLLSPILDKVKRDQTLLLAIRENYLNIYYRGGNLLKLSERGSGNYQTEFNLEYAKFSQDIPDLPKVLLEKSDSQAWVDAIPNIKNFMDEYFSAHQKLERENQQLIARENNRSSISNESEYFITDIELADIGLEARFDMASLCWPAQNRKKGNGCHLALIEFKFGDAAIDGASGLIKHLEDIVALISGRESYIRLLGTVESQFKQLDQLGMLSYHKSKNIKEIFLDTNDKPEVILIIADHNPRSEKLRKIVNDPNFDKFAESQMFDLKFFCASYSGYGMHVRNMLSLNEFRKLV